MARTTKPKPKKIFEERSLKHKIIARINRRFSTPNNKTITPMGGHLVNPPENCPWKKMAYDGGMWAEFPICGYYCELNKECERYRWFKKASDLERAREWKGVGVRYFMFGKYNQDNV